MAVSLTFLDDFCDFLNFETIFGNRGPKKGILWCESSRLPVDNLHAKMFKDSIFFQGVGEGKSSSERPFSLFMSK